jgi:uncharacterized tellurite resistance protein B-like protein
MFSLKKLFHFTTTPRDGLTQGQREAIVDLLNYCSFVDHDISASEDELIDDLEHQFHWDTKIDFDYYVNKSVGAIRGVLETVDSRDDFLASISKRLDSKKAKAIALSMADKLFKADSSVTVAENETYKAIKEAIGQKTG